ncbi:aminotransferase class V-fold PLP-dependent enzyme [Roseovarius salis]|uniref:trans-sulfuration enzyme family protein n=1 Tax=Roseovarius salis TaxID=3376063 RepID=UPI0037C79A34
MTRKDDKPATIAAHAAGAAGRDGGVVPGVEVSTTFARDASYALTAPASYGRDHNATVAEAEAVLQALEGAAATRLFPSGMAAAAALFRTLPPGARAVVQSGIYYGVTAFARDHCSRHGIALEEVDAADPAAIAAALDRPVDLVWIEVPSNPWLKVADIAAVAERAHAAGALLAVDGTAATPVLTRALELGADFSMHSATKAINGHTDVVAGVLSCRDADGAAWQAVCADRHDAGALLGPFEAWLLMRGMRTLPLRMERMCANASRLAEWLDAHPGIEKVLYPGLPGHPGHALAKRQMCGAAGYLMSVLVRGDALAVAGRLRLFQRATSLGGVESLVEHRATIEPQSGIPDNLLRLSVGIEDIDDLIGDLETALRG